MEVNILTPRYSLNKAFLKVRPERNQIETFKHSLITLFDHVNESESEEYHKNLISAFLKDTWYSPNHFINTKGRADLVIHSGKNAESPVGVLFETKKPGNRSEMPSDNNISCKAFYELILYYLRERITLKNIAIKYLVITDIYEWYIFSSSDFENLFVSDKKLVHDFTEFEEGRLASSNTEFFYNSIAAPFVAEAVSEIPVTWFDIRDYESFIKNTDRGDDSKLITLYKILSPEHLLKLSFANDSNSLDKSFYSELLHIIGLEETKQGSRKVIGRKKEERRNPASLIENSITILQSEDCLRQIPALADYGNTTEEQLFNVSLELAITWIDRILFLKLLEGQLVKYNGGNKSYKFLDSGKVNDFDELNKLFFQVLAVKEQERSSSVRKKYSGIPYLNSSLFEPSELERRTIKINSLDNNALLPLFSLTVLKDQNGKKRTGAAGPLEYLFGFLDAYDFSGEGSEEIQEENKTLINASVLGLIFEKINGYKDGSFFTPGFITMYMCYETITRAVVQKFNDAKGWNCENIADLYNKITDITEANRLINTLKICDPAVGSGHFLVSALNEIIAIKSELGILADKEGKRLKDYHVEVVNDELVITGENGEFFEYNPKNRESQRVQETLFHEKQTIIENCLFGVDINPNSVKICRLRLWIELLKNAYYKTPQTPDRGPQAELETLPNIDINIKCGNSLISRYPLDADIKTALKSSRWTVDNYREAVMTYRNAGSKDEKRSMEELIAKIKGDFEAEVSKSDKRFLRLNRLKGELVGMSGQGALFDMPKKEKDEWNKKVNKLTGEISKLEAEIVTIRSNKIYEKAFEWRFEFPEVLNNDGDFVGFDVVIGNPPYILSRETFSSSYKEYLYSNYSLIHEKPNLFLIFLEKGYHLLKDTGKFSFIIPNSWTGMESAYKLREHLLKNTNIVRILNLLGETFEDVSVETSIVVYNKDISSSEITKYKSGIGKQTDFAELIEIKQSDWLENRNFIIDSTSSTNDSEILKKIKIRSSTLENFYDVRVGLQAYEQGKGTPKQTQEDVKRHIFDYKSKFDDSTFRYLGGSDIKRYYIDWSGQWLRYGKWLSQPKSMEQFSEPRILIREITSKFPYVLESSYVEEAFLNNKSILNILQQKNDADLFSLLGYLNSKLMSFYHVRQTVKGNRNIFPKIVIKDLKNYPIIVNEVFLKISPLAKTIHYEKCASPLADTSILEKQIDNIVYKLYELTPDEIRIVEGG
jgi:adenine-specific DNA-methyltransferase